MRLRSDILVVEDAGGSCGNDRLFARRAWVDNPTLPSERNDTPEGHKRLLLSCWPQDGPAHGTVFEAGKLSVYVEAPVVVWWQATRHRIASFNLESGRYKVMEGCFYAVPPERATKEPPGFRPMRPKLETEAETWRLARGEQEAAAAAAWASYQRQLDAGVAREVARLVLPFSFYYSGYIDMNPRGWLNFFSKRKAGTGSFPQWEIESLCVQVEALFAARWPLLYEVFTIRGRKSP